MNSCEVSESVGILYSSTEYLQSSTFLLVGEWWNKLWWCSLWAIICFYTLHSESHISWKNERYMVRKWWQWRLIVTVSRLVFVICCWSEPLNDWVLWSNLFRPQLSGHLLRPQAHVLFLLSDLLYNNTKFVMGDGWHKNTGGGGGGEGRIVPSLKWHQGFPSSRGLSRFRFAACYNVKITFQW